MPKKGHGLFHPGASAQVVVGGGGGAAAGEGGRVMDAKDVLDQCYRHAASEGPASNAWRALGRVVQRVSIQTPVNT